jgi:hypothetical protein
MSLGMKWGAVMHLMPTCGALWLLFAQVVVP